MNVDAFLKCLSVANISTGTSISLEGIYSPASGVAGSTGILYNQLYTTGYHFVNGYVHNRALPLLNVKNVPITGSIFSGNNAYRFGYQHSGNFGLILDIEYSGCTKGTTSGSGYVLLTSSASHTGLSSGFMIGINDGNRLYCMGGGKSSTLSQELGTRDFVYVALTENQYVSFGIYKLRENTYHEQYLRLPSAVLNTSHLYLGDYLSPFTGSYTTGFKGKINNIVLFNDDLKKEEINGCSFCSIATGYQWITGAQSFSGYIVTGTNFLSIIETGITGYSNQIGTVSKSDGSTYSILYSSGVTGVSKSGTWAIPLFNRIPMSITGSGLNILYDRAAINQFTSTVIEFENQLVSGDFVEVNSYLSFNPNVSNNVVGRGWPTGSGVVQLIGNGLCETFGVDFTVERNSIEGFYDDDILLYDLYPSQSVVTDYSGWWAGSKTLMSGGSYFPPSSQYYEATGITGKCQITGLNRVCTGRNWNSPFGFDLYMNGQKLTESGQYEVSSSGSNPTNYTITLYASGLPLLYYNLLYSPTGGSPTGISNVSSSELTFVPHWTGYRQTGGFYITSNTKTISISGFSEMIWVNGLRQGNDIDYWRRNICSKASGYVSPPDFSFVLYNSQRDSSNKWNSFRL